MKFSEWPTLRQHSYYPDGRRVKEGEWSTCFEQLDSAQQLRFLLEEGWCSAGRPYYSVYPVAMKALLAVKLSLPASSLQPPLNELLVRFSEGNELHSGKFRMAGLLAVWTPQVHSSHADLPGVALCLRMLEANGTEGFVGFRLPLKLPDGDGSESIEDMLEYIHREDERNRPPGAMGSRQQQALTVLSELGPLACRIICGISLLANDPSLVQPEVLNADQDKTENASPERLAELVEKAKRRGKFGYSVGASWEVMPHYRRPHFAIRWFGPKTGEQVPKLVPVVGAVVHRTKLADVPTGYLDDEEPKPN